MDFSPPPPSHPFLKGVILAGSSDSSIRIFHLVSHTRQRGGVDMVDALDMIPPMRDLTFREMLEHEDADESDVGLGARRGSAQVDWEEATSMSTLNDESEHLPVELVIEPAGQCWAPCTCAPGMGKTDLTCARCHNQGHTELVRSVWLGESVMLSGSYDSTVKVGLVCEIG